MLAPAAAAAAAFSWMEVKLVLSFSLKDENMFSPYSGCRVIESLSVCVLRGASGQVMIFK